MISPAHFFPSDYPIRPWRWLWDVGLCWILLGAAIYLCVGLSWAWYPVSVLLIANRLLALSLLCHEAVHGTLHPSPRVNDFVGRYLCGFPAMVSLSCYRRWHTAHHRALGSQRWDPDLPLYNFYPRSAGELLRALTWKTLSGSVAYAFLDYYTYYIDFFRGSPARSRERGGDFRSEVVLRLALYAFITWKGWWGEALLLYFVPMLFVLQPYVLLMAGLQHGGGTLDREVESRSIVGPKWLMEILLPVDIGFHGVHHQFPGVPHYRLREFHGSARLREGYREESYGQAIRSLFGNKPRSSAEILPRISFKKT